MKTKRKHTFAAFIKKRFGGKLAKGSHAPDGVACALEAMSQFRELEWADDPQVVRCFDVRALNDALWSSDELRLSKKGR